MITDNRDNEIKIPADAQFIIDVLSDAGYEAYVVGGCVRDSLLNREPEDWDITTSALPEQVKSLFSRTVDTGIEHGTVSVLSHGKSYEVTTYRTDGKYSDGRHPDEISFTPCLEEDLKRRDFTINALAYNREKGLVDIFDGIKDLDEGIIRCVGDANERFSEDALRIMRAVRFAAQLSFEIEDKTYSAIRDHAQALSKISMERIRVEFEKTLMSDNPEYVNKYKELGLDEFIIRDEACGDCFSDDVVNLYRQMTASEKVDRKEVRILRLAVFFSKVGEEKGKQLLRKLTYDNKTKDSVARLLKYKDSSIIADVKYIKRQLSEMGAESFKLLLEYRKAEILSGGAQSGGARCAEARCETMIEDAMEVFEDIIDSREAYDISMLNINGKDLIDLGVTEGKEIGETLAMLLEKVIEEPALNSRDALLKTVTESAKL